MIATTATTDQNTAADIEAAIDRAQPHLDTLRALQAGYDDVGWNIQSPLSSKFRHMLYHLRDALGALDRLVEANEHAEHAGRPPSDDDIRAMIHANGMLVADLLFGVLQLAELGDINTAGALRDMWARNARQFAPDSPYADLTQVTYTETPD